MRYDPTTTTPAKSAAGDIAKGVDGVKSEKKCRRNRCVTSGGESRSRGEAPGREGEARPFREWARSFTT
jgi:hypothetical protein